MVSIRTGQLEEHIVADVAWGAWQYWLWTGDEDFLRQAGYELLADTARYWASRVRRDGEGRAHIDDVIGPDEYHEAVNDNAFTNVMARWNLRTASTALSARPDLADDTERAKWDDVADALVDNYDSGTGLYEQFDGFFDLEPLIIRDVAPRRPIVADLLLGAERVRRAQVLKQADVLMLHFMVPSEVAAGSLVSNLQYYEPRTAHGSSLSPGVHAALFARAGRLGDAVEWLRLASRIDLDDVTGTTAGGLHLATMGGVWQAVALGFLGIRAEDRGLRIDPHLPSGWPRVEIRLSFRGSRIVVRTDQSTVSVTCDRALDLAIREGSPITRVDPPGIEVRL